MFARLLTIALLAVSAPTGAATEEKVIEAVGGWLNYGLVEIGGVKLSAIDFGSALLILLGSETQKVLTHCQIPVLVHR